MKSKSFIIPFKLKSETKLSLLALLMASSVSQEGKIEGIRIEMKVAKLPFCGDYVLIYIRNKKNLEITGICLYQTQF